MLHFHEFRAMNTSVMVAAEGSAQNLSEPFKEAEDQVRAFEKRFTRFSVDSELSALNRSSGRWFAASPDLYEVVALAQEYYHRTGGLFNPGVLGALEEAGYDRTFDEIRAASGLISTGTALPSPVPDFGRVELRGSDRSIRLPLGLRIDLGGIAKGWIAEQTALYLSQYTPACAVNAGGDQFAVGLPLGESGWIVGLEDPFELARDIEVLNLPPGAVATSTTTRRHWQQNGKERHHLIDPRTGEPAQSHWVSVTVIAPRAAQAEVLAKSLLIGGPVTASHLLARFPGSLAITVDSFRKVWGSVGAEKFLMEQQAV